MCSIGALAASGGEIEALRDLLTASAGSPRVILALKARGQRGQAQVEEGRLDTLAPSRRLVAQRLAQPGADAQEADVVGRDPRLWQPAL
jgi:hypothetical protein